MKLREIAETNGQCDKARKWIRDNWDKSMSVRDPKTVDVELEDGKIFSEFVCVDLHGGDLPFEFADGMDLLSLRSAKTLKGCPKSLDSFYVYDSSLDSFEGVPETIGSSRTASMNVPCALFGVPSLKDIHKHIRKIEGVVKLYDGVERNILGLLKIEGITRVNCRYDVNNQLRLASEIINRHLKTTSKDTRVIAAQRELIENDLDDYAQL